jgi:hypothetical protein
MIPPPDEAQLKTHLAGEKDAPAAARAASRSSGVFISQQDNYRANFGEVLRSSAMFWARNDSRLKTTICVTNYWKYKNSIDVCVLINLRDTTGKLIARTKVNFDTTAVYNYSPPGEFDGSIEVEAFSARNLRIPYAAVMAVYECADSISMVHSYARAYSQHEIEDKRTICVGEESCWTLRETQAVTSFCVFHNGSARSPEQRVRMGVRRASGDEKVVEFQLPSLNPFQTVLIEPRKYFPDIPTWLGASPGNGRISFHLEGGFTRCLCGVRALDWSQLQVTHSNFDYSIHETDKVRDNNAVGYMLTPTVLDKSVKQEIVVYPDADTGQYLMTGEDFELRFRSAQIVQKGFDSHRGVRIQFRREDGLLPSRIVTGIRLIGGPSTIAAECSFGVEHPQRPAKRFSWMLVSRKFESELSWIDLNDIYGGCPADAKLVFKYYSPEQLEPVTREVEYAQLPAEGAIELEDLFDKQVAWSESFGWVTAWCSYGGLEFFSTLKKKQSISIEHCF